MITVTAKSQDSSQQFQLNREDIPAESVFSAMISFNEKNGSPSSHIELQLPPASFPDDQLSVFAAIVDWVTTRSNTALRHFDPAAVQTILDFLNIPSSDYLELTSLEEEFMRLHMYDDEFTDHPINTNPYYGLTEITETIWNDFSPPDLSGRTDLLFHDASPLTKNSWDAIRSELYEYDFLLKRVPGLFLAGGRVFSTLFNKPSHDIDLFLTRCPTDADGISKIKKIGDLIADQYNAKGFDLEIVRSANAVTFIVGELVRKIEFQIILRAYRTPSEIIHGFDVDSCAFLYDGSHIFATNRAIYSINNGINTVNFSLLSPSYPYRISKYATKGVAVKVDGFDRNRVNDEAIEDRFERETSKFRGTSDIHQFKFNDAYSHITELKGLNIILYLEYLYSKHRGPSGERISNSISRLSEEHSDYSVQSIAKSLGTTYPNDLLTHLTASAPIKPELSERYLPLIKKISNISDDVFAVITNIEKIEIEFDDSDDTLFRDISNLERYFPGVSKYTIGELGLGERINHPSSLSLRFRPSTHKIYEDESSVFVTSCLDFVGRSYDEVAPDVHKIREFIASNIHLHATEFRFKFYKSGLCEYRDLLHYGTVSDLYAVSHGLPRTLPSTNNPLLSKSKKIFMARSPRSDRITPREKLDSVLSINEDYYNILDVVGDWQLPMNTSFIRTNPGQQMSNAFNRLVLEDNAEWYKGELYD
jgi:hypothetical protein